MSWISNSKIFKRPPKEAEAVLRTGAEIVIDGHPFKIKSIKDDHGFIIMELELKPEIAKVVDA